MHEHASKMELGDKETVAIANVICYLHVIHRYTRMVRTIRVWSYGIQNCTIRVWYIPYAYGMQRRSQTRGVARASSYFALPSAAFPAIKMVYKL